MSENDPIVEHDRGSTGLDVASTLSAAIPWVGGPVSNVLSGMSLGRKLARVNEVLTGLADDLREFKSETSEQYVRTEEFEDLLEKTLRQAADERNERKRLIYRGFLTEAIKSPGEPYDEQVRFLRILEQLQPDHIRILSSCLQEPESVSGTTGSHGQTLSRRLPDIPRERLEDLVAQLNDMRLTNVTGMRAMMTAPGAEDMRHTVTHFGQRFVKYLKEPG